MAKQTQFRRGTFDEHKSFTGAMGEVTVVTDKGSLRVHDGDLEGGRGVLMDLKFAARDRGNFSTIIGNYTDGVINTISKVMFSHILSDWYFRNQDSENTYLTRDDWKNGIYVCFSSLLTSDADSRLVSLTEGVE